MNSDTLLKPMGYLTASFVTLLAACVAPFASPDEMNTAVAVVIGLVVTVALLTFYISLGTLANRLGKNVVVWVGGTIITSPFGIIFSYFGMRHRVKAVINSAENKDAI